MSIQEKIRQKCREKGISVTALEEKLGFGNGSLLKSSSIKANRLFEVAKALDTPMEYFIDEDYSSKISREYYLKDEDIETTIEIKQNHPDIYYLVQKKQSDRLDAYAKKLRELIDMEEE